MSDLYARLGIDFDQLGCVMLDCEPTTFLQDLVPPTFWYRDPAKPGKYGPEMQAHVTLLFGLLRNANEIRAEVDEVLEGWRVPKFFEASKPRPLEVFGGPDAPYDCIELRTSYEHGYSDAHRRLSRLPHIDTNEYKAVFAVTTKNAADEDIACPADRICHLQFISPNQRCIPDAGVPAGVHCPTP